VGRILCAVLWTWLHLLQICVSNQSLNPGEDALNKPWRPIPSGIVSVLNARILRWILLPLCLSLSISLGALWHGISLAIAFIVYNELHLDSHWPLRNACNAWGYASFNAGASAIAGAYYSLHTVFSNDRMPCTRPIDNDVAYFNLICRQYPHNFLDNPCPGFPR
jgi:4-hydroxybenzoate polyprenyltransferase